MRIHAWTAGTLLVVLAIAGCTSSRPSDRVTPPHATPPHTYAIPPRSTTPPPARSPVAEVYIAALGGRAHPEDRGAEPQTYVRDRAYCSEALARPPCRPSPIPADVQAAVVAALGPRVHFTAHPPKHPDFRTRSVVTLGPPAIKGDRAIVTVETSCGPLCGQGETLVLGRRGGHWVRTGVTGPSWIS